MYTVGTFLVLLWPPYFILILRTLSQEKATLGGPFSIKPNGQVTLESTCDIDLSTNTPTVLTGHVIENNFQR